MQEIIDVGEKSQFYCASSHGRGGESPHNNGRVPVSLSVRRVESVGRTEGFPYQSIRALGEAGSVKIRNCIRNVE